MRDFGVFNQVRAGFPERCPRGGCVGETRTASTCLSFGGHLSAPGSAWGSLTSKPFRPPWPALAHPGRVEHGSHLCGSPTFVHLLSQVPDFTEHLRPPPSMEI